jgi:hypothetical protein
MSSQPAAMKYPAPTTPPRQTTKSTTTSTTKPPIKSDEDVEDQSPSQLLRRRLLQSGRERRPLTPGERRCNVSGDIDTAFSGEENSASCNSCSSADEYTPLLRTSRQCNSRSRYLLPEVDQNRSSSCSSQSFDIVLPSSEHSKSSQQEPSSQPQLSSSSSSSTNPPPPPSYPNQSSQLMTSREMRYKWLTNLLITQRRTQRILALRLYTTGITLITRIFSMVILLIVYSTLPDRK